MPDMDWAMAEVGNSFDRLCRRLLPSRKNVERGWYGHAAVSVFLACFGGIGLHTWHEKGITVGALDAGISLLQGRVIGALDRDRGNAFIVCQYKYVEALWSFLQSSQAFHRIRVDLRAWGGRRFFSLGDRLHFPPNARFVRGKRRHRWGRLILLFKKKLFDKLNSGEIASWMASNGGQSLAITSTRSHGGIVWQAKC